MTELTRVIFAIDIVVLLILLIGTTWSIAVPQKRIWPLPRRQSWQLVITWICFCVVFGCNAALLIRGWNTWLFQDSLRFIVGIPLAVSGGLLVIWSISIVGMKNTLGQKAGFVSAGPYQFTRNPQYLGDILIFIGLSVVANSSLLWTSHALLTVVLLITPWCEEPWLEEQYGEAYISYRRDTPRFLM